MIGPPESPPGGGSWADFVQHAPVAIHWVSAEGIILWANDAELELLGYRAQDYIGRDIRQFHADPADINDILQRLRGGEVLCSREAQMRANDGSIRSVLLSSNVSRDPETGAFLHTRCFTQDVTERRRNESELRAALQVMSDVSRAFAEHAFDLQKILDTLTSQSMRFFGDMCGVRLPTPDGRSTIMQSFAHAHAEGRRLLQELGKIPSPVGEGISGQVIVSGQAVLVPTVDVTAYRPGIKSEWTAYAEKFVPHSIVSVPLIVQGTTLGAVLLVRHAPGRPFAERDLIFLQELTDRAALALTTARQHDDLTHERQRLRGVSDELKTVMAAAPAAIWLAHDRACERITGNPESYRVLRMSDGSNVSKSAPPAERPQGYRILRDGQEIRPTEMPLQIAAAQGVEVRDVQFDIVFEDGATLNMFGSALPLTDDDGLARGSVGAFLDVTPLREAIRAREEFLSIVSHELKTPLTSLELYADGILRAIDRDHAARLTPDKLRDKVGKLTEQSRRLTSLINELLDVSRITSGSMRLERAETDLAELVSAAVERFREQGSAAGSSLNVRAETGIGGRWDRARLDRAITNLIGNAVKYGAGKPIDIVVAGTADRATVCIQDRGIGIPASDQQRIFNRFERGIAARHYGGFGLGLWIVKQIVDAHGGSVRLSSELERGSTFVVELPRGNDLSSADQITQSS